MFKIILFILLLTSSLLSKNEEVTLLLSWKNQFQFAGYYMAKEKGFYAANNLSVDIKEYVQGRDNAKDVSSRKYQFGIKHSSIILDRLNNYPNIKLLAAIHQSSPLVLISQKSNILSDLKKGTLNISEDDWNNASINAMLHLNKIDTRDIISIKTEFTLSNFINKEVDFRTVYLSNEPFTLKKKNISFNIYNPKNYGYDFYSDILFTSSQLIQEQPELVKGFYAASMQGWEYAYSHIDETVEVILQKYNTQNRTREALRYEAKVLKKLALSDTVPLGNINPVKLKEIATTYYLLGLVNHYTKTDYADFIYSVAQNDSLNAIQMLKILYLKYPKYIIFLSSVFIFIIIAILYFRYKLKTLLTIKTKELNKSYKLFDEFTIASRTDLSGNIVYVTKAFCQASGYTRTELIGQNHRLLQEPHAMKQSYYKDMWMSIKSGHIWRGEFKNITKNGHRYWTKAVISPLLDKESNIIGYEGVRHDITIKKVLEEFNKKLEEEVIEKTHKLEKYAKYLNTLFDINPNITYVLKNGKLERVNKAFLVFTKVNSVEEFLENHTCVCELFIRDQHHPKVEHHDSCNTPSKVTIRQSDKEHLFILTTQSFHLDEQERQLITLENITTIQELAIRDKLTGLYNRVKIDEEIAKNYSYYEKYQDMFALILIDIDFFKIVNDTYGHLIGDEVLKDFAKIIQNNLRSTDIVGRWGGEEFIIICPNTDKDAAYSLASTIKELIQKHLFTRNLSLTLSAGISDIQACHDIDTLLLSVDKALYRAKENGRNRIEVYQC